MIIVVDFGVSWTMTGHPMPEHDKQNLNLLDLVFAMRHSNLLFSAVQPAILARFLIAACVLNLVPLGIGSTQAQAQSTFNRVPFRTASHRTQQEETPLRSSRYSSDSAVMRLPNLENVNQQESSPVAQASGNTQEDKTSRLSRDEKALVIDFATVEFIDDITLPALEAGAIAEMLVEEGQFIEAGTVVGRIDDSLLVKELEQALIRYDNASKMASTDVAVRAAMKKYELRLSEYNTAKKLYKSRSRSESEVEQAKFEVELALLQQEKASLDQTLAMGEAQLELKRMETVKLRIKRHTIKSDYNAYVVEIFKKPQEYVNIGDEVMKIGRMDKLWVQGLVDAEQLAPHEALYRPVTVTYLGVGGKAETFEGRIDQIPLEMQGSTKYKIKVRVNNRKLGDQWLLRPLAQVSIKVHLDRGFAKESTAIGTQTGSQAKSPTVPQNR